MQKQLLWLYLNARVLITGKVSIPYMDFDVTTRCSLNCKDCCHAMPLYNKDTHVTYNFDKFASDLNILLQNVDIIYDFEFLGGEPLLVTELDKMIRYVAKQRQIRGMTLYTNGTIVPSHEVLQAMHGSKRFLICISNYAGNRNLRPSLKHQEIISLCEQYGVRYHMFPENTPWFKTSRLYTRNKMEQDIQKTWNKCWQRDNLVFCDGKLYPCQKALAIHRNLKPQIPDNEIVDFRQDKEANKTIKKFFSLPYMHFCDYCSSEAPQLVKSALQTEKTR